MNKHSASNKIYVGKSKIPDAGRGVFAKVDIKKGVTIETCPTIEIPETDITILNGSVLVEYVFFFGKNKKRATIALGFGSIYNHSDKPSITYIIHLKEKIIEFIALENINKNDELTFNYHGISSPKRKKLPLWFQV